MNYLEQFRPVALVKIGPLADHVLLLERQLAALRRRLTTEQGNVGALEQRHARLKESAGAQLTGGQNSFEGFRRNLRKLAQELEAAREIVATFTGELIPGKEAEIVAARAAVQSGLLNLVKASMPVCESKMAELIALALAERDSFMACFDQIAKDYGADFTGRNRLYPEPAHLRPDPSRPSMMIQTGLEESLVDSATAGRRRGPYLTPPPAPPEAPATSIPCSTAAPEARSPVEAAQDTPEGAIVDSGGPVPPPGDTTAAQDDAGPETAITDSGDSEPADAETAISG